MSIYSGNYHSFIVDDQKKHKFFDTEDLTIKKMPQVRRYRYGPFKNYYLDFDNCRHQPWLYFIRPDPGEDLELFRDIRSSDRRSIPKKDKIVELFFLLNCHPLLTKYKDRIAYLKALFLFVFIFSFVLFGYGLKNITKDKKFSKLTQNLLLFGGLFANFGSLLLFQYWVLPRARKKYYNMRRVVVLEFSHDNFSSEGDMRIIVPKRGQFFMMLYSRTNFPFLNQVYAEEDPSLVLRRSAPNDVTKNVFESPGGSELEKSMFL